MARVSTYLNFPRSTEEAFNFYKSVFGGEFTDGIKRFDTVPPQEGAPPMAEADKNAETDRLFAALSEGGKQGTIMRSGHFKNGFDPGQTH